MMINPNFSMNHERAKWGRKLLLEGWRGKWTPEAIQRYEDAIKAENNTYGFDQEVRYWQLAADTCIYGWTVNDCIHFKEQDVACNFKVLPGLYASLSAVLDNYLLGIQMEGDK